MLLLLLVVAVINVAVAFLAQKTKFLQLGMFFFRVLRNNAKRSSPSLYVFAKPLIFVSLQFGLILYLKK